MKIIYPVEEGGKRKEEGGREGERERAAGPIRQLSITLLANEYGARAPCKIGCIESDLFTQP